VEAEGGDALRFAHQQGESLRLPSASRYGLSVRLVGTATTAEIMGFRGKAGQFSQKKGFIGSTPCLLKYSVITRDSTSVMEQVDGLAAAARL
jgi:hypothetical protein